MAAMAGVAHAQGLPADPDTAHRAVQVCAACHGDGGRSVTAAIPSLAGQTRQYVIMQLQGFRCQRRAETGTRASMWGVSAFLDDATITGLADYYTAQTPAEMRAVAEYVQSL